MSTPFATPAAAVDVAQTGPHRLEAHGPGGTVLGTASRSRGRDEKWIGWLIEVGSHREVVATITTARVILAQVAAGGTR